MSFIQPFISSGVSVCKNKTKKKKNNNHQSFWVKLKHYNTSLLPGHIQQSQQNNPKIILKMLNSFILLTLSIPIKE